MQSVPACDADATQVAMLHLCPRDKNCGADIQKDLYRDCPTYDMSLVGTFSHPFAEPRILAIFRSGIPLR